MIWSEIKTRHKLLNLSTELKNWFSLHSGLVKENCLVIGMYRYQGAPLSVQAGGGVA
jgi:hypothetical protein